MISEAGLDDENGVIITGYYAPAWGPVMLVFA